ncbi:MAG: hypothetical protein ACYTG0_26310, partial [Planctomycetota bacterium]
MCLLNTIAAALLSTAQLEDPPVNPVPPVVVSEPVTEWSFEKGADGWTAENHCVVEAGEGLLKVAATGDDPYMHVPVKLPGGHLAVEMKARCSGGGNGQIYWTTDQSPQRGEDKVKHFPLTHDGQWHQVSASFHAPGTLTDLRIDPGGSPGEIEIDWIRLIRQRPHPLTIERVEHSDQHAAFIVKNHTAGPVEFSAAGKSLAPNGRSESFEGAFQIGGGQTIRLDHPAAGGSPLETVTVELDVEGFPPARRTVFVHRAKADADWITRPLGDYSLLVARDGSTARVRRGQQLVAVLAPLVHCDGKLPVWKLVEEAPALGFEGDGVKLTITTRENEISVAIAADTTCEGPVVRALGGLEQGLFAGLEYLGKGEMSSSKLDVETEEHLRFAPDPMKVTMPLAAFVTDRASVAMTWSDMQLRPTFATPNFFDGSPDHRMALRGKKIEATILVDDAPLEEAIYWAVKRHGLPPLPKAPRTADRQWDLCLAALEGPLQTENGWGHCVEERWPRHPHADMASTVWRLTGRLPEMPRIVSGGAHVRNDAVYFLTGRADQWKKIRAGEVAGLLKRQQPDGSFRYSGKYARGHFEDTASGVCARPAAMLLEHARLTGDAKALEAGLRTLEYMKRFRTPRGAQVWEVPLHTPDQLASAYLVWAYVRGYELTGNEEYLRHARKWALSGVPFVYLWSRRPIMLYATPPVFGATNWRAPCWIGLPVQWVGGVYAYALTMLAPHDD